MARLSPNPELGYHDCDAHQRAVQRPLSRYFWSLPRSAWVGLTGDVRDGEGARGLLGEKDVLSLMTGSGLEGSHSVRVVCL
jgi:hypothetical protein